MIHEIIDHSPPDRFVGKSDLELMFSMLRNSLPTGVEDPDYDRWLKERVRHCFYQGYGGSRCSPTLSGEHVLGGYQGTKACGLLKTMACDVHNSMAETDKRMHLSALGEAVRIRLEYECEKLREAKPAKRR